MSKGFIMVASVKPLFYALAVQSCHTLKTYYPDCNVTLFTHEEWVDQHVNIFDNVITGIPANNRAKMWAMARTPYDLTVYVDVDSRVQSKKILDIFDQIQDNDFVVVPSTEVHISNPRTMYIDKNQTIKPVLDGSFMLYRSTEPVLNFLQLWYDEYQLQCTEPWSHDDFAYEDWKGFDMFTVWGILKSDRQHHPSAYKPEYEDARKLKWNYIEKYWNTSHLFPSSVLKRGTVIAQIDKPSIREMEMYKPLNDYIKRIYEGKNEVH